jgi:hypothetical protein
MPQATDDAYHNTGTKFFEVFFLDSLSSPVILTRTNNSRIFIEG